MNNSQIHQEKKWYSPVMNISNSAEKMTVGGRRERREAGALSGNRRGESHL